MTTKRQHTTLTTPTGVIAEWITGQPVTDEQQFKDAWQTANDLAAVLGHQPTEKSYQAAAFVQAFIGTCYFCGGSTGPDGKGNQVCANCGRIQ